MCVLTMPRRASKPLPAGPTLDAAPPGPPARLSAAGSVATGSAGGGAPPRTCSRCCSGPLQANLVLAELINSLAEPGPAYPSGLAALGGKKAPASQPRGAAAAAAPPWRRARARAATAAPGCSAAPQRPATAAAPRCCTALQRRGCCKPAVPCAQVGHGESERARQSFCVYSAFLNSGYQDRTCRASTGG